MALTNALPQQRKSMHDMVSGIKGKLQKTKEQSKISDSWYNIGTYLPVVDTDEDKLDQAIGKIDEIIGWLDKFIPRSPGNPALLNQAIVQWRDKVADTARTINDDLSQRQGDDSPIKTYWKGDSADAYMSTLKKQQDAARRVQAMANDIHGQLNKLTKQITDFYVKVFVEIQRLMNKTAANAGEFFSPQVIEAVVTAATDTNDTLINLAEEFTGKITDAKVSANEIANIRNNTTGNLDRGPSWPKVNEVAVTNDWDSKSG